MNTNFQYEDAKKAGFTDQQIKAHLLQKGNKDPKNTAKYAPEDQEDSAWTKIGKNISNFITNFSNPTGRPEQEEEEGIDQKLLENTKFDVEGALNAGFTPKQINDHLKSKQPERSKEEKATRLGLQYGIGALGGTTSGIVWDISTSPLASKEAQNQAYRETLSDDLEMLLDQKSMGQWDEQDQKRYENIIEQLEDPQKFMEYIHTADVSIRGLTEKATGMDLEPEGVLEHAANWSGFIKNPKNLKNLAKIGLNPKSVTKAILPTIGEATRGLSAGVALEMAKDNQFGPLGTITAAVVGDIVGHAPKGIYNLASNPKRTAAQMVNLLTNSNSKKLISKELAESFKDSGILIDAGTLTQSPLIQSVQARLTQSGLTGTALDNLRNSISESIVNEYKDILKDIGELSFENNFQASEAIKEALKVQELNLKIPKEKQASRSLQGRVDIQEAPPYQQELLERISPNEFLSNAEGGQLIKSTARDIKEPIKQEFNNRYDELKFKVEMLPQEPQSILAEELKNFISEHQGSLLEGVSKAESGVLDSALKLFKQLETESGAYRGVKIRDLIKTKQTLGDVAKWEFGGSNFESAYKKLVGDIDRAIERSLGNYPELLEEYQQLNAEYSQFKDVFENKNLKDVFAPKNHNYNALLNQFTTNPDKLQALEQVLGQTERGQEIINQVKRDYVANQIQRPNVTPREIRDLEAVIGPQYQQDLQNFMMQRLEELENPLPRARRGQPIGIEVSRGDQRARQSLTPERVSETSVPRAKEGVRKKMYEYLSKKYFNKSPESIMNEMNTVKGIRELKRVLSLTPEGKELFKELSRYKISEMIDKKMTDSVNNQIKMGTFSRLGSTTKEKAILKELLGGEAFTRLEKLQNNVGKLAEASQKFFNASKSGTSLIDMGLMGSAVTGVLSGNPFMALPALLKIGGGRAIATLISDPVFLKELEKAILTKNPKKFQSILENLQDKVINILKKSDEQEIAI